MNITQKLSTAAFALATLTAAVGAQAQSIDVRVIGTISPAACAARIDGGGTINYGVIPASSLNMTSPTELLSRMSLPFAITCNTPVLLGLRVVDNRAESMIPGITSRLVGSAGDVANFGLGTVDGKSIGGYEMELINSSMNPADGDTVPAFPLQSADGGQGWVAATSEALQKGSSNLRTYSLSANGQPEMLRGLFGLIRANVALAKGEDLPLTDEIPLDGSATIELVYL